jgi:prophage tail gpP-like protein
VSGADTLTPGTVNDDGVLDFGTINITAPRYVPPTPAVSSSLASTDPNEVIVQLGANRFQGWKTASITLSCETLPNSFSVTASVEFIRNNLAATRSGQPCTIFIGKDTVITGWLDRRTISTNPTNHGVTLTGRGLTRNLVDCSADLVNDPGLKGGMMNATNTLDLATRLSKAYGVTVRSAVADLGIPILPFQVALGETPYQIIESVARYAGYLVYEDNNGKLVLDRIGTNAMASGFTQPGNIESLIATQSEDGRYSDYVVVYQGINTLTEISPLANQRAIATDPTMPEHRVLIQVSRQLVPAYDVGLAMANWEFARRLGRSQAARITCDSWRDGDRDAGTGKLWTPNWLAPIEAPDNDITGAKWIIGTVTFRKDLSGTHADLVLMPPAAFTPQPNPLNLWNAEVAGVNPSAQSPAPASTNPAQQSAPWLPGPATTGPNS